MQLARIYRLAFSCKELFFLTRSKFPDMNAITAFAYPHAYALVCIYQLKAICSCGVLDGRFRHPSQPPVPLMDSVVRIGRHLHVCDLLYLGLLCA